jgi:Ni,Fe-hydrogenase III small subunit
MLGPLQGLTGTASNLGSSILGGLYSNFEKMDRATIKTVIPVDAQIPLDISVPVQTTTQITLSETVNIPNAQVVINTGGLNINSNARVTLPAGTPLTVNLNFNLPVQTTIPVHLDVPVNIPMSQTELHEPFVGLQDVVRPLYCLVEPGASSLDGRLICR